MGGDEEVGKLTIPQLLLKVHEKLLEAVAELTLCPVAVLHAGSTGMKQCGLGIIRAELVRLLKMLLLQPLQEEFQKFQTLLSVDYTEYTGCISYKANGSVSAITIASLKA